MLVESSNNYLELESKWNHKGLSRGGVLDTVNVDDKIEL